MHQWITHTTPMGEVIQNPTEDQLRSSLQALFAASDDEHPDMTDELSSRRFEGIPPETALMLWLALMAERYSDLNA